MGKRLGDDPALTMDYLEQIRLKVRETGDSEIRALLGEIRRLHRMILQTAHYTRTATAAGGTVRINQSLLEDLHRLCMMEPVVVKHMAQERRLIAPPRLAKSDLPIRARSS